LDRILLGSEETNTVFLPTAVRGVYLFIQPDKRRLDVERTKMNKLQIMQLSMMLGGILLTGSGVMSTVLNSHPLKTFGFMFISFLVLSVVLTAIVLVAMRLKQCELDVSHASPALTVEPTRAPAPAELPEILRPGTVIRVKGFDNCLATVGQSYKTATGDIKYFWQDNQTGQTWLCDANYIIDGFEIVRTQAVQKSHYAR
jgi:hypothetical protein